MKISFFVSLFISVLIGCTGYYVIGKDLENSVYDGFSYGLATLFGSLATHAYYDLKEKREY